MKDEINQLTESECRKRRTYTLRQFEVFKQYANLRAAEGNFDAASSFIAHMQECNDYIDACNTRLGDSL